MREIRGYVPKNLVEEVAIFQIGKGAVHEGEWVIRCFGFGRLGDCIADEKPTDQELKDFFENENLIIADHYEICSRKFYDLITEPIKNWKPNFNVIISGFMKDTGKN